MECWNGRERTGRDTLEAGGVERGLDAGDEVADEHAGDHAEEDGGREEAVEEAQLLHECCRELFERR